MNDFKFDVIIGNPPYQENAENTSDKVIYPAFMEQSYKIGKIVEFITPAKFLFKAGKSYKKDWNKKILSDRHLKVIYYNNNAQNVFGNLVSFEGGVVVTYRDSSKDIGPIGTFTPYRELNSVLNKVKKSNFISIIDIVFSTENFKISKEAHKDYPDMYKHLSDGHLYDLTTNIFSKIPFIFLKKNPNDGNEYVEIYGRENGERVSKYIKRSYIKNSNNLFKYKIILPKSNGSKPIGVGESTQIIGKPLLIGPLTGHNQTFISIGSFNTKYEGFSAYKYICSKFARAMLGTLKVTQHNSSRAWENVPLQDFTSNSDIDWSKSIKDIDSQLYKKYNLSRDEIEFIESNVKEMK